MIFFEFEFATYTDPGYRFYDNDGAAVEPRSTANIVEIVTGKFVVGTEPPDGFTSGWVLIDDGGGTPVYKLPIRVSAYDFDAKIEQLLSIGRRCFVSELGSDLTFLSILAAAGEITLPSNSGVFNNHAIAFQTGVLKGLVRKITTYTGSENPLVVFDLALPIEPEVGDELCILGRMS